MDNLAQARKLIKDCQETQNPYLDLGRCGITDLNDLPELFECTHLETLILSNSWKNVKWDGGQYKSNNDGRDNILNRKPCKLFITSCVVLQVIWQLLSFKVQFLP
jgi:hypothetical protein